MDCIYIAPLSKALYNLCLSFTRSHTHSHTNGDWRPCKVPTSSSGAIGVRCLAQGHFDMPRVGSNRQPSDCQTTALPPEPYRPYRHIVTSASERSVSNILNRRSRTLLLSVTSRDCDIGIRAVRFEHSKSAF